LGNKPEHLGKLSSAGIGAQWRWGPLIVAASWGKPIASGKVAGDDKSVASLRLMINLM